MKSLFKLKPKTPSDLVRQTRDLLVSLDLSGTEGKESRRGEKMMDLSELIRELKQVLYGNCESEPVAEACAQLTSEFFRKLAQMACLINNNMGVLSSATNRGTHIKTYFMLWDQCMQQCCSSELRMALPFNQI